ncbi:hypothetical protein WAI453_005370 [Rhynchosporium graminicola]
MHTPIELGGSKAAEEPSTMRAFCNHLRQTEPVYARLMELKDKGWANPKGNEHFEKRRQRADDATGQQGIKFYRMMQEIGDEMQKETSAFTQVHRNGDDFRILGLCMGPGGYTYSALKYNPGAEASGITLPPSQGGHEVFLLSSKSTVIYKDITIFSKEFGVEVVPLTHPEYASFSAERPFNDQNFDLVICDGQVLRTPNRPEYREATEATRLTISQLILGMQRIRKGGTLIMLLHRIEGTESMKLLYTFSRFSDIEVFKPVKKHAIKSTFYLIAKNVNPDAEAAKMAVEAWKKVWWNATFGGEDGTGAARIKTDDEQIQGIIDSFGVDFVSLAKPIWDIQADGLRRSDFAQ